QCPLVNVGRCAVAIARDRREGDRARSRLHQRHARPVDRDAEGENPGAVVVHVQLRRAGGERGGHGAGDRGGGGGGVADEAAAAQGERVAGRDGDGRGRREVERIERRVRARVRYGRGGDLRVGRDIGLGQVRDGGGTGGGE